tara:strand:- start:980 stop:1330 length:351 start_codon:yes stop_codon:yes gene_type:complete
MHHQDVEPLCSDQTIVFDGEEFHPSPGFEDIWVSRSGRVYGNNGSSGFGIKKIYRQAGKRHVKVMNENGRETPRVLTVVIWTAFNGPVPKKYHIIHADGDPTNHALDNLELRKGWT